MAGRTIVTKVFISSTGRDLVEYREAAIETCLGLGFEPVAMEQFEAMGLGATAGSLKKLEDCALYVGIFAHRYGYIEAGYDRSVTEMEYDHAGRRGLERLCFLIDPDHPWPFAHIDMANYARLSAFKEKIEKEVIRAQFTTVDSFSNALSQALIAWIGRHPDLAPKRGGSGPLNTAPPPPDLLIGREEALHDLKQHLGLDGRSESALPVQVLTAVRGWPGVGKTTVAAALANDSDIRAAFPDGILWASLGERPNLFAELFSWLHALTGGQPPQCRTAHDASTQIASRLRDRRALLIVDDVWQIEHAKPFQVGGKHCAALVTTRSNEIAQALAPTRDDIYWLPVLTEEKALDLLRALAPSVVKAHPDEARALVRDLEGLPLALQVAGRLLEAEAGMNWGIADLLDDLRRGAMLKAPVPANRIGATGSETTPTVAALLRRSTDALDEETRDRFALLGAFAPKPATFDLEALAGAWQVGDARPTVRQLVDRGLLEPVGGRFQMHALLVQHARSLLQP